MPEKPESPKGKDKDPGAKAPAEAAVTDRILPLAIEDEMKTSYLNYAMSVIVGRALPDVRDGLKPVHRRILYAMRELGLENSRTYKKSARIVGECLGKYHPHGDTAVYDTLVRMVQDFSMRYPLVDGQGNFGCFTGDTKIKLLDGRDLSFEDLAKEFGTERNFYVYSVDENGRITVGEGRNPRITRRDPQLMELTLDNGEKIRCTPDHRFQLRDGTYKEARHLTAQDSLMPGYFRTAPIKEKLNECLMVLQPSTGEYEFVHQMADRWSAQKGLAPKMHGPFVRHHKNFNRFDNRPDNIQRMTFLEHLHVHAERIDALWNQDSFRTLQREGVLRYYKENPEAREARRRRFTQQNRSEEFRKANGSRTAQGLRLHFARYPEERKQLSQRMRKLWEDPDYRAKMSIALRGIEKRPLTAEQVERVRRIISEKSRAMWNSQKREEIVQALRLALSKPEIRRRISENSRRLWKDPAYRAKYGVNHFSRMAKILWANPNTQAFHRQKALKQWQNPKFRQACREAVSISSRRRVAKDPGMMKRMAQKAAITLRARWLTEEYRMRVLRSRILRHGANLLSKFPRKAITPDLYDNQRRNNCFPRAKSVGKYFKSFDAMLEKAALYNHRIVSARWVDEKADVWDITVDEHHNFLLASGVFVHNSVDGDSAAALRYTEARIAPIASYLLNDIDKETVDFGPNFDDTLQEPKLLPATLPNLLVNGSSGIAVGMATNIPPHNLREVIDAILALIDDPNLAIKDLQKFVKGPDFPTGANIVGTGGIKSAYETGRGLLRIRAKASIEEQKGGREAIIVTEIPYQVNKSTLIETIADLVNDKKIEGIADVRDESDRQGMRIVVILKRDAAAQVVLNQLYKHTQMQSTFGIILLALADGRPKVMNLKEILEHYIRHRKEIIIRRSRFELEQAKDRAHILEGLKVALDNLDRIIKTIRRSKTPAIAKDALMENFDLSDRQAQAILEMQLQRLTGLEREKIDEEYRQVLKRIDELETILRSEKKVLEIIKHEATEIREKFGDDRRTQIVKDDSSLEMEIEDLIADEDVVVTITHKGYVKRSSLDGYRKQRRGGVGVIGGVAAAGDGEESDDFVEHLFIASTHDHLLLFTSKGKVYTIRVHELPQGARAAKGKFIKNFVSLNQGETASSFVPIRKFEPDKYVVMMTKDGVVKKTELSQFENIRKNGIAAINLHKSDELISVRLTGGRDNIFAATRKGKAIHFPEKVVRGMGRAAAGVRGIRLGKDDAVIGMEVVDKNDSLLTVTEKGFAKRTKASEYRLQSRGGKGITNIKITSKNGPAIGMRSVNDQDELMVMSTKGMVVRVPVKDIRTTGRAAQGVRVINLKSGDHAATMTCVEAEESLAETQSVAKTA